MSILDKLSKEELDQLLDELRIKGYDVKEQDKSKILKQEAIEIFNCEVYFADELSHSIYAIADFVTDNYEKKGRVYRKKKTITADNIEDYRKAIRSILETLKPYFGMPGFRFMKCKEDDPNAHTSD